MQTIQGVLGGGENYLDGGGWASGADVKYKYEIIVPCNYTLGNGGKALLYISQTLRVEYLQRHPFRSMCS